MVTHDFSARLSQFDRWRRRTYARGFVHGAVVAIVGAVFFAWYFCVGAAP